jgi:hypothetical protein
MRAPSLALLFAEPLRAMLDALGSHVTARAWEKAGCGLQA